MGRRRADDYYSFSPRQVPPLPPKLPDIPPSKRHDLGFLLDRWRRAAMSKNQEDNSDLALADVIIEFVRQCPWWKPGMGIPPEWESRKTRGGNLVE